MSCFASGESVLAAVRSLVLCLKAFQYSSVSRQFAEQTSRQNGQEIDEKIVQLIDVKRIFFVLRSAFVVPIGKALDRS